MLTRLKRDLTMADAARAPGGARVDLLLVADMVTPRRARCSTSAAATANCCGSWRDARRRRPRHRAVARGRQRMRRQGPRGDPGRRRHRPCRLSGRRLRLRDPVADAAGDAAAARGAGAHAAHRPPRRSCRSRISAIGGSACSSLFGGHMPQTDNLPYAWWDIAQHPLLHDQGFPRAVRRGRRQDGEGGGAQRLGRAAALQCAVVVLEPVRRAGGVPAQPRGLRNEVPRARVRSAWSSGRSTFRAIVETDIPARLDRLPWSRFHTLVVAALGITWILDGLEVTLAGARRGRAEGRARRCTSAMPTSGSPAAPIWPARCSARCSSAG